MKYRTLLKELVIRDIKIKYRRSILGLLWTVLNPLLMMVILTVVFSTMFKNDIENFSVYLMCGQVIFNFYSESTSTAMSSIVGSAGLIKKVYVPKYLFPLSKVLSCFVNLVSSVIALTIVMVVTRTPVNGTIILAIIPIVYVLVFSMGVSLMLASLTVFFRDILHLYSVLVTAWMYLTPIFYPLSTLPENLQRLISYNPLANFIELFREVVLYGKIPSLALNIRCIIPCVIVMFLGTFIFYKQQDKFILKL